MGEGSRCSIRMVAGPGGLRAQKGLLSWALGKSLEVEICGSRWGPAQAGQKGWEGHLNDRP